MTEQPRKFGEGTIRMKADQFPCREALLRAAAPCDPAVQQIDAVRKSIVAGAPIEFMPITYRCGDIACAPDNKYGAKIWAIGLLRCGIKAAVIIDGFSASILMRQPQGCAANFGALYATLVESSVGQFVDKKDFRLETKPEFFRPLIGFSELIEWRRVTFTKMSARGRFLTAIKEHQAKNPAGTVAHIESADDMSTDAYASMIARRCDHVTANWNTITKYTPIGRNYDTWRLSRQQVRLYHELADCSVVLSVSAANMRAMPPCEAPEIVFPRILIASWDIETSRHDGIAEAPNATLGVDAFRVEIIGIVFSFPHESRPLLRVGISSMVTADPRDCDILIECGSEREAISAFVEVLRRTYPDVLLTFNGGSFDWPLTRKKLIAYDRFIDVCAMFSFGKPTADIKAMDPNNELDPENSRFGVFRSAQLKITADLEIKIPCVAHFEGMCDLDLSVTLRQLFPKAQVQSIRSLDAYLEIAKLPKKVEMPIRRLLGIFERGSQLRHTPAACHCGKPCIGACKCLMGLDEDVISADQRCCFCLERHVEYMAGMADAIHYCIHDCCRPLDLMRLRNILIDKREICAISHVGMYDVFYYAIGQKLRNLVGRYADRMDIVFSSLRNREDEWGKFEGATVLAPIVGLYNVTPVTALDFGSLYPNAMRTMNFSPDCIVRDPAVAAELSQRGYTLAKFDGDGKGSRGMQDYWVIQHNGVFDSGRIVTSYSKNCSGEYEPIYGREALPHEHAGVFAVVVQGLLDMRKPVKARFGVLEHIIERMNADGSVSAEFEGKIMSKSDLQTMRSYVNAKQLAIKVMVNSLYGVSGEIGGTLYMREVGAGVTNYGRQCLEHARSIVTDCGFVVTYGDTDSLYIRATEDMVRPIYAKHGLNIQRMPLPETPATEPEVVLRRVAAATELVEFMYHASFVLKERVRDEFVEFSGRPYLVMEFEEICFPFCLCGKKKYFAIQHKKQANFDLRTNELFVRGIDTVKQTHCAMVKRLVQVFMERAVDVTIAESDWISLACNVLADPAFRAMDTKMFETFGTYKSHKNNVPVRTYVQRMTERRNAAIRSGLHDLPYVPADGDKFSFVICKVDALSFYDKKWRKIGAKVGNRMFPLDDITAGGCQIDVAYYITRAIGVIARIVSSHFADHDDIPTLDKKELRHRDDVRVRAAKKALFQRVFPNAANENRELVAIARAKRSELKAAITAIVDSGRFGECPDLLFEYDTLRFALGSEAIRLFACYKAEFSRGPMTFVDTALRLLRGFSREDAVVRLHTYLREQAAAADQTRIAALNASAEFEPAFTAIRAEYAEAVATGVVNDAVNPALPRILALWRIVQLSAFRRALVLVRTGCLSTIAV